MQVITNRRIIQKQYQRVYLFKRIFLNRIALLEISRFLKARPTVKISPVFSYITLSNYFPPASCCPAFFFFLFCCSGVLAFFVAGWFGVSSPPRCGFFLFFFFPSSPDAADAPSGVLVEAGVSFPSRTVGLLRFLRFFVSGRNPFFFFFFVVSSVCFASTTFFTFSIFGFLNKAKE